MFNFSPLNHHAVYFTHSAKMVFFTACPKFFCVPMQFHNTHSLKFQMRSVASGRLVCRFLIFSTSLSALKSGKHTYTVFLSSQHQFQKTLDALFCSFPARDNSLSQSRRRAQQVKSRRRLRAQNALCLCANPCRSRALYTFTFIRVCVCIIPHPFTCMHSHPSGGAACTTSAPRVCATRPAAHSF